VEKENARDAAKRETRAALIRAGLALFSEEGLDGPSLDAICERAGFTRGAFYVHFKDRDDFLVAVMESAGEEFLDVVLGGDAVDLPSMMQRFVMAVAGGEYLLTKEGGVRPHQLLDACARSEAIRTRYVALVRDSIARLEQGTRRSQSDGAVRKDVDPGSLAAILLATVVGAQTMLELGVPLDIGAGAATMLQLLAPRKK
jgi:TetR/AcrR family transcriptional repressor of nem operon